MPRLRASDGQRKPEVLSQKAHSQGAFFLTELNTPAQRETKPPQPTGWQ